MASTNDDFPWRQLGVLAICRLAEPVAFCSITAYAFVMVQDINGEKDASFYAGLLISAFALAEACTAWIWGDLSDRFGRRPIIMVALAGTALSSLIFGFAKNYWVALAARVVGGLLNGNVAVMQTMVAEMVHKPEHEPKAYAMQPFMWSLGSIAGSAMGGFTAQPARFHPGLFSKDGIFGRFPYLLPNLIAAAVVLLALILGLLFLEETNPAFAAQAQYTTGQDDSLDETAPLIREVTRDSTMSKAGVRKGTPYLAVSVPIPNDPAFDLRRSSFASIGSLASFHKPTAMDTQEAVVPDEEASDVAPTKTFTKGVVLWMLALWLLCYHQMAFNSVLPVYLLDDPKRGSRHLDLIGGLGQTLPAVGTLLAVNSVISLVVQGVIFPFYVGKLGVKWTVLSLAILAPLVYLAAPFVTLLPDPKVGTYIIMVLQSIATTMNYPVLLILIKNATPSTQVLGRVNGIAMSGCSGARTIAPPLVGIIYSAIGSAAAWWSCGIIAMIALVEILVVPNALYGNEEAARKASTAGGTA